jgi:hypothetical protein
MKVLPHFLRLVLITKYLPRRQLLLAFLCIGFMSACAQAPSKSMTVADRSAISRIRVQPHVEVPVAYLYGSPVGQTIAAGGGIMGAIASDHVKRAGQTEIGELARAHGFSLAGIVKDEFVRASATRRGMKFSGDEPAPQAHLSLKVKFYGFQQSHGWGSTMYPFMVVIATLQRPDGAVVWEATESVNAFHAENKQGYDYAQYTGDPEKVRQALARAAGIVSRALVSDLYK